MRTRQLSDLQADVQKAADIQNSTAFIPLADITQYINQGWTRIYGILCRSGENYYLNQPPSSFTTVSGQSVYYTTGSSIGPTGCNILDTTMYLVKGVDVQLYGSYWRGIKRFQFEERNDYQQGTDLVSFLSPINAPRYDYQGSGVNASISFIGLPLNTATPFRVWHYPAAAQLSSPTDTFDGGNGWELYAIWWAARECAHRDENYELSAQLDMKLAKMEQDIKAEAASRNAGLAPRIRRGRYGKAGGGIGGLGEGYGP
jgi:hypothetical protein